MNVDSSIENIYDECSNESRKSSKKEEDNFGQKFVTEALPRSGTMPASALRSGFSSSAALRNKRSGSKSPAEPDSTSDFSSDADFYHTPDELKSDNAFEVDTTLYQTIDKTIEETVRKPGTKIEKKNLSKRPFRAKANTRIGNAIRRPVSAFVPDSIRPNLHGVSRFSNQFSMSVLRFEIIFYTPDQIIYQNFQNGATTRTL